MIASRLTQLARHDAARVVGALIVEHGARGGARPPHQVPLGQVRANLSANVSTTLTIKLTTTSLDGLRSAIARHQRVSVQLTLAAANGNGTGGAGANVASLKLR